MKIIFDSYFLYWQFNSLAVPFSYEGPLQQVSVYIWRIKFDVFVN